MTDDRTYRSPTSEPPTRRPVRASKRVTSRVLVHTGAGKGKSSAAMGVMLRSVSAGGRVAVVQFVKSGTWRSGEEVAARSLGVDWWSLGDGFTWDSKDMDRSEALARGAWRRASELIRAGEHRLLVLDEITYPMTWGWIDTAEVVETIRARPDGVSIVATGRDAPPELREVADTVTEMVKVRHAYDRGIRARRGIDY